MENQKVLKTLHWVGVLSSVIFPAILIVSFILHHFGEYSLADLTKLKLIYIPPTPERFLELFSSNSALDFILTHLPTKLVNMHYEKNCILNKEYSQHEWEKNVVKIIDHMRSTEEWGEFFPHKISPFGYNETVAQEYFPMTEEGVREK